METIIKVNKLSKKYEDIEVLKNINFEVKKGEFIGLLGSNGSGKTTLLKSLCGLLKPSEGEVSVLNYSPWTNRNKILKRLGIMIETPVFYEHLTVYENIKLHLDYLNEKANIESILDSVGLLNVKDKQVSKLSMGMKQNLAIARAISHNPEILLLDEPINGLDPVAIKDMRELFISLQKKGTTIILSSHILGEILQTVESIVIISNKNLQVLGSIKELQKKHGIKTEDYLIERMRG